MSAIQQQAAEIQDRKIVQKEKDRQSLRTFWKVCGYSLFGLLVVGKVYNGITGTSSVSGLEADKFASYAQIDLQEKAHDTNLEISTRYNVWRDHDDVVVDGYVWQKDKFVDFEDRMRKVDGKWQSVEIK